MRQPGGVSGGHGADKRQISAPKTRLPAASQVTSIAPLTYGVNDLARFERNAFPAA